jgi:hypothetical protein
MYVSGASFLSSLLFPGLNKPCVWCDVVSSDNVCASGCNATTISEALGMFAAGDGGGVVSVAAGLYDQEVACTVFSNVTLRCAPSSLASSTTGLLLNSDEFTRRS